jgi:hypothetical protein
MLYFGFSALQIARGLPCFRRGSSTMQYEGSDDFEIQEDLANCVHASYIAIPYLTEIRCCIDFCLS